MDFTKIISNEWLSKATDYIKNPEKLSELLEKVKKLFGKEGLKDVLDDLKLLYNYVHDIVTGSYKDYSKAKLAIAVAALIYVVSPIDIIPDFLPGGFIDDVAIIGFAIKQLHDELEKYKNANLKPTINS